MVDMEWKGLFPKTKKASYGSEFTEMIIVFRITVGTIMYSSECYHGRAFIVYSISLLNESCQRIIRQDCHAPFADLALNHGH